MPSQAANPVSQPGHYRRSCDRCHDQKLRCKRDNHSQSCQRCLRAKAKCTFSAPQRSRPSGSFIFSRHTANSNASNTPEVADPADETAPAPALMMSHASSSHEHDGHQSREYIIPPGAVSTPTWDHSSRADFSIDISAVGALGQADMDWEAILNDASRMGSSSSENTWVTPTISADQNEFSPMPTANYFTGSGAVNDLRNGRNISEYVHVSRPNPSSQSPHQIDTGFARQEASMQGAPLSRSNIIRNLSDLSVKLHDFSQTIPSVQSCMEPSGRYQPLPDKEFALDCVLRLSQHFIETLNHLAKPTTSASSPDSQNEEELTGPASVLSTKSRPSSSLDQPCELLILSTYTRIIETYHAILEHVAACANGQLNGTLEPPLHIPYQNENFPRMPALTIGSFTMESSSATQVLMLVHMMEVMMTRSRYLTQSVLRANATSSPKAVDTDESSNGEQPWKLTAAQSALQGFRPQEDATVKLLGAVRRVLFQVGHAQ
ncbi:hypothetical protein QQS21_004625 [Conoideocrella luteorostrata]|uniref:Zn(2)-C6 fungal-type domain-containing protein n=1 Tax=Conoideocrella luteorostrata TaxID=1105319 RepID=A0AAJ0CR88_9HYPO|nr:hypothetical protein QQS21_004625 [Conoideocrella luteorostrata]